MPSSVPELSTREAYSHAADRADDFDLIGRCLRAWPKRGEHVGYVVAANSREDIRVVAGRQSELLECRQSL
jgi:hypothetical protein